MHTSTHPRGPCLWAGSFVQRFLVGWGWANLSTCPLQESKSLSIGGAFHTFGVLVPQHFKRRKKENKEGEKERERKPFQLPFYILPSKREINLHRIYICSEFINEIQFWHPSIPHLSSLASERDRLTEDILLTQSAFEPGGQLRTCPMTNARGRSLLLFETARTYPGRAAPWLERQRASPSSSLWADSRVRGGGRAGARSLRLSWMELGWPRGWSRPSRCDSAPPGKWAQLPGAARWPL